MFIGAAAGVVAGAVVGHIIDEEQRKRLREQSPQTWATIQHNDYVLQQQMPPPSGQSAPPPAVGAAPQTLAPSIAATAGGPPAASSTAQSQPTDQSVVPLTLEDIKALAAAGVKPEAIIKEIENSKAVFGPQDIAAAEQSNPPMAASVLEFMKNRTRPS
jgi:hypothetical protein